MQDICIIGGSNSLLRNGWSTHFREICQDRFRITNLSIGAATSLMGIFRLLREGDVPDDSTVIWEYALNESNHFRSGQSLESLMHHLDWFMEIARRRRIRVLPVIFWTRPEHLSGGKSEYRIALQERLLSHGLSSIDAWRPLEDFATNQGADIASLFSDNMHYSVDNTFLRGIAEMVVDRMPNASVPKPAERLKERSLKLCAPSGESDQFKNSIIQADTFPMDSGEMIVDVEGRLLASFVIAAKDAGAISVSSDERLIGVYSLQSPPDIKPPAKILKHIVHWRSENDLRDIKGSLTISGCNPVEKPITQNMFSWRGPLSDRPRMDAYICALIEQK